MTQSMRALIVLLEKAADPLPEDVVAAFQDLGAQQRDQPEFAMLRVQHLMGGGVLNPVVEHLGDITHRMSHLVRRGSVMGYEKVQKVYEWLTNGYGFEREFRDNIASNARYRGVDATQLTKQISAALREYAQAHARLPVYNHAQWLARQAAVDVGLENFDEARKHLRLLLSLCPNQEAFAQKAMEFHRAPDGGLRRFSAADR